MVGILGLILSFFLFSFLTFHNWNIAFSSMVAGAVVAVTNEVPIWTGFAESYAQGFSEFAANWWILFVLGAVFGKCMQDTGMSQSMASIIYCRCRGNVIFAVLIISLVLSYGGIGTFIIAFTVYPIALELFQRAGISKKLLPAAILFCPTTICMTMLPGTPSVQNMLPTKYLETDIYAAPLYGVFASLLTGMLGYLYLYIAAKKSVSSNVQEKTDDAAQDEMVQPIENGEWHSLLPCIVLWGLSFVMIQRGGDSQMAVAAAMFTAIVICVLLRARQLDIKQTLNTGVIQGLQTLAVTSCIMGYGALVQSTNATALCMDVLFGMEQDPLVSSVAAINLIALITGSSTVSLQLFYKMFTAQISAIGLSDACIHRITAIASGGLDSMPYATGVVVTNDMAKTKMRDTYLHIFITCALIPLITLFVLLVIMG